MDKLSERDLVWLQELADGARLKCVDKERSEQVVKNRMRVVRKRLSAETNIHVVAMAIRQGWID